MPAQNLAAAAAKAAKARDLGQAGVKKPANPTHVSFKDRIKKLKDAPTGAKVGAAVGIGALVVFGAPAILPLALGAAGLGGYYYHKHRKYSAAMTPERIKVYEQAISSLKDAKKLRALADEFDKAGCKKEAEHLRKRAALQERSPAEKAADKERYKKALADVDSKRVLAEAAYFDSIAADGCAKNLRTKAEALKAVGK